MCRTCSRLTCRWKLLIQVLNAAWDAGISVASENALPCFDREGYNKILENAKPRTDPDGRHLAAFTYLRLNDQLMQKDNLKEFTRFVKRLHGLCSELLVSMCTVPVLEGA